MKAIKLLLSAILISIFFSVSAQWNDTGAFSYTTDAIGIGYASNPIPAFNLGLSVYTAAYINQNIYCGGKLKAYTSTQRWDFGWGPTTGANVEFYSTSHPDRPGQMRFIFGGSGVGNINYLHYNGTGWTSCLFVNNNGNIGIGTETPGSKLTVAGKIYATELGVNGKITSKEVVVTLTGWSDYVFEEDYKLSPLFEVEKFIKENKHLPGIPTGKQIVDEGLSVGKMNQLLMAKVEELTLYVIQLKKEIDDLKGKEQ